MTLMSCIRFWNNFLKSYPLITFSVILFSFLKTRQEIHRPRIQLLQDDAKSRKWGATNYFLLSHLRNSVEWLNQNVFLPLTHYVILTYCWAFTQVIVDHRESWQLNIKGVLSALRGRSAKIHFFLDIVALKMYSQYWEASA